MSISLSQRSAATPASPTRQQLDELDALLQRMLDLPVNKLEIPDTEPASRSVTPPVSYTAPDVTEDEGADEVAPPKIDFQALKQRLAAQMDLVNNLEAHAAAAPPAPESAPATAPGDDNWVPLSSTWQPSSLTWKPLAQSWQQQPAVESALAPFVEPPPILAKQPNELPVWEPTATAALDATPTMAAADQIMESPSRPLPASLHLSEEEPITRWATPLVWFNLGFDWCLRPLGPVGRLLQTRTGRLALAVVGLGCLIAAGAVVFIDWIGWTS